MHNTIEGGQVPIFAWTNGVPVEDAARQQLINAASLPFIHDHIAVMPDVHFGRGATVGSVLPTKGAIVPAAVGVDIGCGMMAVKTSLTASDLPDSLSAIRSDIERAVPHGGQGAGGGWKGKPGGIPNAIATRWRGLEDRFKAICARTPHLEKENSLIHLGSLGSGNHFIELCLDEAQHVWVMLHSGSRGIGNAIGRTYIEKARELLTQRAVHIPDKDLAWLAEGEPEFDAYVEAMLWAQDFAMENRKAMIERVLRVLREALTGFTTEKMAVNCHHNYVSRERHFGADVWVTRKGAVKAGKGDLGIIPGSMGAKSFIVRGLGNPDSFESCSHGAGRALSRTEAKRRFTVEDHERATAGIECRKDIGVLDETPMAYKDIDAVMAAQSDLVEIVHALRQVVCVKG
ncbi:MAG TPA: RtcB family protein [Rhizomicrobium sp.]|jgi:tRNA-splicing ligase RtcB|nr:RtcB family protein [Rhizomicrobium sp.]